MADDPGHAFCPECRRAFRRGHDEECGYGKLVAELDSLVAEIVRLQGEWDELNDMRLDERARVFVLHAALETIRDRDWTENALNPQWPADIAKSILRQTDEAVGCETCGAPAGHPCNADAEGVARSMPHEDRWKGNAGVVA